jgi:hypothetical protein
MNFLLYNHKKNTAIDETAVNCADRGSCVTQKMAILNALEEHSTFQLNNEYFIFQIKVL